MQNLSGHHAWLPLERHPGQPLLLSTGCKLHTLTDQSKELGFSLAHPLLVHVLSLVLSLGLIAFSCILGQGQGFSSHLDSALFHLRATMFLHPACWQACRHGGETRDGWNVSKTDAIRQASQKLTALVGLQLLLS